MTSSAPCWVKENSWSYPTLHVINVDESVGEERSHLEWITTHSLGPMDRDKKLLKVLNDMKDCLSHLLENIKDVAWIVENTPPQLGRSGTEAHPVTRLLYVFSSVVRQYVDFFAKFIQWVRDTYAQSEVLTGPVEQSMSRVDDIKCRIKNLEILNGEFLSETSLPDLRGKWVCLTPQEITILFIRVYFDEKRHKTQDTGKSKIGDDCGGTGGRIDEEKDEGKEKGDCGDEEEHKKLEATKSTLKDFLDFLLQRPWATRRNYEATSKPCPLVPAVVCFDETRKRLGISKPTWPTSIFHEHPWMKFVVKSRDARVDYDDVQHQFREAQRALNDIAGVEGDGKIQAEASDWIRHRSDFRAKSGQLLAACNEHVWQAIDAGFRQEQQCGRCRCYYSGVDVVYPNDDIKCPKDTKTKEQADHAGQAGQVRRQVRPLGPCAESCLYAEEILASRAR
ncbi:MAG: hypothetical protein Q9157_007300 [Trypethelium eluteriae]